MKGTRRNSTSYIPMQVIPALPGFFVIDPVFDTDKRDVLIEVSLDPVLGWALDRDSLQPYPVTLDGVHDEGIPSVLKPDGSINRLGAEGYDNIDQWKADLKHCYQRGNY